MSSKQRKLGMGQGLKAVLGNVANLTPRPELNAQQASNRYVSLADIVPNPEQPRKHFDEEKLQELSANIAVLGILTPLTLRKLPSGTYQIIAGERRFRAAKMAGLKQVPAFVMEVNEDLHSLELAIVENLQREDLNPIELAHSFQHLLEEYNYTHEKLSERLSKSRATITNVLRLLKLPPQIQALLRDRQITEGHARAILALDQEEKQMQVCEQILSENLSVRATEQLCNTLKNQSQLDNSIPQTINKAQTKVFLDYDDKLSAYFQSKVQLRGNNERGKIIIEYNSASQLKELLAQWGIDV